MAFSEFENSPLEPLKVVYPYKYRKNPKLMKNTTEFKQVMESLKNYTMIQIAMIGLLCLNCCVKLLLICLKFAGRILMDLGRSWRLWRI